MGVLFGLLAVLFWLGFMGFCVFLWWKIIEKTGYHGALSLLFFVPFVNIVFMAILAFKEWPIHKQLREGGVTPTSKPLSTPMIILIVVGCLIIPMILLLSAIAIPNLLRAKMSANEALAKATLRAISTASESYATANKGYYPQGVYDLTTANPPYLNNHYCDEQISGYSYTCSFDKTGYKITATPISTGSSGSAIFTIVTGGIMTPGPDR